MIYSIKSTIEIKMIKKNLIFCYNISLLLPIVLVLLVLKQLRIGNTFLELPVFTHINTYWLLQLIFCECSDYMILLIIQLHVIRHKQHCRDQCRCQITKPDSVEKQLGRTTNAVNDGIKFYQSLKKKEIIFHCLSEYP